MKKMLLLCGALLLVSAGSALAANSSDGLHMYWDGCGGANFKTSACTSNTGNNVLVLTWTASAGATGYQGVVGTVNVATDGTLPAWWGNACAGKTAAQTFSVSGAAPASCPDDSYGGVAAGGGISAVRNQWQGVNTTQVEFALANAEGSEVDLTPGTEYFIGVVNVSNRGNVGGAAGCTGCLTPACINFADAKIDAVGFGGTTHDIHATDGPWVSWQSNPATPSSCFGATPAHTSTWGSVKALYR